MDFRETFVSPFHAFLSAFMPQGSWRFLKKSSEYYIFLVYYSRI